MICYKNKKFIMIYKKIVTSIFTYYLKIYIFYEAHFALTHETSIY